MLQSSLRSLKQGLFFTQILHLLRRSGRETFRVGTEPPAAHPAVGLRQGVPSLLEAWAEAGNRLSRMQSVMQSPFSLLHTQISPTCWFAFDKGGSLSPAAFLLARLAQQLAGICSSSSSARFSAAEIPPPKLNLPTAPTYPCVSADWVCRNGTCPPLSAPAARVLGDALLGHHLPSTCPSAVAAPPVLRTPGLQRPRGSSRSRAIQIHFQCGCSKYCGLFLSEAICPAWSPPPQPLAWPRTSLLRAGGLHGPWEGNSPRC